MLHTERATRTGRTVTLTAFCAIIACGAPEQADPPPPEATPAEALQQRSPIPGCDHITELQVDLLGEDMRPTYRRMLQAIGRRVEIPEYHDCQWLVNDQGNAYHEGRVAVFSVETTQPTGLAAIIFSEVVYGNGVRRIDPGVTCVYLDTTHPNAVNWKAAYVHDTGGPTDPLCDDEPPNTTPINVFRTASGHDIPQVARWDWDPGPGQSDRQAFGIPCVDPDGERHWCTVGAAGSIRHTVHPGNKTSTAVVNIPGWYDEQQLAVMTGTGLHPDSVATIFPDDQLDVLNSEADYQNKGWIDVAYVTMSHAIPDYESKFNFKVTPDSTQVNVIAICHGEPDGTNCPMNGQTPSPENATWRWWARITAPDNTVVYRKVKQPHPHGQSVPPVTRWRWLDNDESFWIRCIQGCCEVDDEF